MVISSIDFDDSYFSVTQVCWVEVTTSLMHTIQTTDGTVTMTAAVRWVSQERGKRQLTA